MYQNRYQAFGSGDSGGPISIKIYDASLNYGSSSETKCLNCFKNSQTDEHIGGKRHVIVAVMAAGIGIKNYHDSQIMKTPYYTKCTQVASKVTQDVVDWIKKLHVDALSSGIIKSDLYI